MQEKIAEPTIGRVVYFYIKGCKEKPAIVQDVIGGHRVLLFVFLSDGYEMVECTHVDEPRHGSEPYWDWMPFQKGQAAKTEHLQAELDKKSLGPAHHPTNANSHTSDMGKLQAGAPSPVDGKR